MTDSPTRDFVKLPVRVEDITSSWLSQALSVRFAGVEVTVAENDHTIHGTASKLRMRLTYNAAGEAAGLPATMWVKLGLGEHRHFLAPAYYDEMLFYRDLQPVLGVNTPRCYFAGHDPDANQSLVLLEDLGTKGARLWRSTDNLTYEQAMAVLDAQAVYHAKYWESPELEEGGSLGFLAYLGRDTTTPVYVRSRLVLEVWASYLREPRGVVVPRVLQDRDWMERAFAQLMDLDVLRPHCVLHGDAHLGNMYSDADGKPGFLDWQMPRKGPWAHDVTYFIVSALDLVDRRQWEKPLLSYYLERLRAYGVRPPGFDEVWLAYRQQIVWGLFFWMVNPLQFQPEAVDTGYACRFAMAAIDVGTREVMG